MKELMNKLKENKYYQIVMNSKITKSILSFYSRGNVKYVLFLYLVAFCLFAYTLLTNYFTIPLGGDFVLQEIPFYYNGYDDWWTYFKTGEFVFWDENTNLGANNIGSNSFYYYLNIFFLPTLLVPRQFVPQMQAFLMMTKMVLAGYVMKRLLELFKVSDETSKMVGVAYAFCGWTLYYLWFNHFIEITIVFPLVIYGLEKLFKENKISNLILSLFLSAMTNYFFFIMICFCTVIYAVFRYFQLFRTFTNKQKREIIILGIVSYAIAIIMSCIVLLPCFSVALESSRADSSSYSTTIINCLDAIIASIKAGNFDLLGHNLKALLKNVFYFSNGGNTTNISNVARVYLYPLATFFYPTVSCNDHILINNSGYDNSLSSLFVYTPIMIMLVPSIITSLREKKISHIVAIVGMLILIFTPFAYYCFSGFTNVSYGRWQLFPVVCIFIYVAINFDKREKIQKWYLDVSVLFVLGMEIFTLIMCEKLQGTPSVNNLDVDAKNVVYAQMAYVVILYIYLRFKLRDKELANNLRWTIAVEALVSFNLVLGFTIGIGDQDLYVGFFGTTPYANLYGGKDSVDLETKIIASLKKNDDSFYRIYNTSFSRNSNNLGMVESYNGLGTFHSIYNFEIDDFCSWTHFKYNGSWSMGEHEKKANLDTFLNVKYYITNQEDTNIPFGYSLVELEDKYQNKGKVVYQNDNYIPLGFNFPSIVNADHITNVLRHTNSSNYYLSGISYTGYVPKAEYLLTSEALLYDDDVLEILEDYPLFKYQASISFNNYFQGKIFTRSIKNEQITLRRALWDDGPGGTGEFLNEYEEYSSYSNEHAKGMKWNSQLIANLPTPLAPDASSRGGAYVTINARMGENLIITLYDQDGVAICSDRHMKHNYDKSADKKYERGFYVDRPVYKIQIDVKDTFKPTAVLAKPNASYQYYDTYKENLDLQKQRQFTNVKCGVNKYEFDSNLEQDMISVLTIPYDKGWSLYRYDENNVKEEVKIYKGQGGFVSFVNESGNNHYKLEYHTPHLALGSVGFIFGSMMFAGLYYALEVRREEKEYIKKLTSFE